MCCSVVSQSGMFRSLFFLLSFLHVGKRGSQHQILHATKSVQCPAISFQSIHDVLRSDGLSASVFSVGNSVSDDLLEEVFQVSAGLFIDQTRNTLASTSTTQSSNSWFRDTLNGILQHLPVTFRCTFTQSFATFATSGHDCLWGVSLKKKERRRFELIIQKVIKFFFPNAAKPPIFFFNRRNENQRV